jgi:hypothetical protein
MLQQVADWETCQQLAQALQPEIYQVAICSSFRDPRTNLLSRQVAILAKAKAYLAWSETWQNSSAAPAAPGGFAFAAIRLGNQNIGFFSVQFSDGASSGTDESRSAEWQQARAESARQLIKQIDSLQDWKDNRLQTYIVAGDFNTTPDDVGLADEKTLSLLEQCGFDNAFAGLPLKKRATLPGDARRPAATLDYIFTRDAGRVGSALITQSALCERGAVTCEMDLAAPKAAPAPPPLAASKAFPTSLLLGASKAPLTPPALAGSNAPPTPPPLAKVVLNRTFDGRVYESHPSWEVPSTHRMDVAELTPARNMAADSNLNAAEKVAPWTTIYPPRDPQARPGLIDLTAYYNALLTESWQGNSKSDLASLPTGLQKFEGVEYDVRGIVQAGGKERAVERFPARIEGIKIQQKCARLNFLHSAGFGAVTDEGQQVGSYIVHFTTNRMPLVIPIIYGHDVRNWRRLAGEPPSTDLDLAWRGPNAASANSHNFIRLFTTTWVNIVPGAEIESIDFVSSMGKVAPFLIAITAE